MDDAVRAEDVDGDNARIEIDGQAPEGNLRTKALRRASEVFATEGSGNGARNKNTASRVKIWRYVVGEDFLDEFL